MNKPLIMYFLCVHNRRRSQMAEAFAKHYAGDKVIATSAGVRAKGRIANEGGGLIWYKSTKWQKILNCSVIRHGSR